MNAEYQRHRQIWQALKPKVDVRLEPKDPWAWARPLAPADAAASLAWAPAIMDPAAVAHGIRELASALSE